MACTMHLHDMYGTYRQPNMMIKMRSVSEKVPGPIVLTEVADVPNVLYRKKLKMSANAAC